MGYFLLRESMLDSTSAKKRWPWNCSAVPELMLKCLDEAMSRRLGRPRPLPQARQNTSLPAKLNRQRELLVEGLTPQTFPAALTLARRGGALFPSHATLFLAPVGPFKACREKQQTFDGERQRLPQSSEGTL